MRFGPIPLQVAGGGTATASCDASQITIVLSEVPDISDPITACVRALGIAKLVVASLGFALGYGYSVELIQVTEEDGTPHVFGVKPTDAGGKTLGFDAHQEVFRSSGKRAGTDAHLRSALLDYTAAIADPYYVAFYCYRAIEAIAKSFASEADDKGWNKMHETLGTTRESIEQKLKPWADPLRHGNLAQMKPTTAQQRWEMLELTRNTLKAYLDWIEPPVGGGAL